MLKVEIQTGEIPDVFVRFKDAIDERYWLKRTVSIKDNIRGQSFLRDHLVEENAIAFALARCSDLVARYGRIPMQEAENRDLYPAIGLAAQVLSIMEHSSDLEAKRLISVFVGLSKTQTTCAQFS